MTSPAATTAVPPPAPQLESLPTDAVQLFLPLLTHSELHGGFIVLDAAGRFVYVSESMRKLLGFSAADLHGCARRRILLRCTFGGLSLAWSSASRLRLNTRALRASRRAATDFVVEEDQPALQTLWADAAELHRAAGGDVCTGHVRLRADGGLLHVDVRACTDGQYIYKARCARWLLA
jgi:hypothetical protein